MEMEGSLPAASAEAHFRNVNARDPATLVTFGSYRHMAHDK